MKKQILEQFAQPGSEYRGKPFWAWNGELEPEELRRQIRIMRDMGLGGFFMHSRVGLDTAYLSDRWFECVDACVDEAEKLNMEAWMYDEDRWPSGAAGGLVTKTPAFRRKFLAVEMLTSTKDFSWSKDVLAAFTAEIDLPAAHNVSQVARGTVPTLAKGQTLVTFTKKSETPSSWYNDQSYLDTMDHDAVKEFIKVTHEAYAKRYGGKNGKFGKIMPGIFTDEPNHGPTLWGHASNGNICLPWTDSFEKAFKERHGYDLIPKLLEVVFFVDGDPISQPRLHYHDVKTHLFVTNFTQQIGDWCEKNGIQSTGHMLMEDSPHYQTNQVGSCMRHYEYMQAPGMDLLTEHWLIFDVAKQVSSVAHQFGRKWRLTETYGCTGWDFPFMGHKMLGDWQAAIGINLRCQHLSWYTMKGEAKRDYPASIFYQSPWWQQYSLVEDYFGRVGVATTQGEEVRDVLVIHPIESCWSIYGAQMFDSADKESPAIKAAMQLIYDQNSAMFGIRRELFSAHIDFDYGDEDIMARHAKVGVDADGPYITINKATYRAIVVPMMHTMRHSTLKLLQQFKQKGGAVIFADKAPTHLEAAPSNEPKTFAAECIQPGSLKELPAQLESLRRVSIADEKGTELPPVLYLLREDAEAFYLFATNTSCSEKELKGTEHHIFGFPLVRDLKCAWESATVSFNENTAGAPQEWNPTTGERYLANAKKTKQGWKIDTSFPQHGSRVFVFPKKTDGEKLPKMKKLEKVSTKTMSKKTYDLVLSEPNVLVMNRAEYRFGNAAWSKTEDDILQIDCKARDALGVRHRGGEMCQPWARPKGAEEKSVPVALRYTFDVATLPSGELSLALEFPERFEVRLNGTLLPSDSESGWWVDRSLRRLPFDPALLRMGKNTLELTCNFTESHGLEYIYLLGAFGVKVKGLAAQITAAPTQLKIGDWVPQGLPFYSGNVTYRTKLATPTLARGERAFLQVPEWRGVGVRVLIDGVEAGIIGWAPYELDITDFCKENSIDLRIEVLGHRRNSHGPFHLNEKWPEWTGPGSFYSQDVEKYQLVPCGLLAQPKVAIRK